LLPPKGPIVGPFFIGQNPYKEDIFCALHDMIQALPSSFGE